jgi:hypothetical protein
MRALIDIRVVAGHPAREEEEEGEEGEEEEGGEERRRRTRGRIACR